jgi:lipoic acid synthetase
MADVRSRLPDFVVNHHGGRESLHHLKSRLRKAKLRTVCESARCPNINECFTRPTAAFMILGNRCTRCCGFCAVENGGPLPVDPGEPKAVAEAAADLGLRHVVVTSVTRDDLADGGASHFTEVVRAIKSRLPEARVETLVPDFRGSRESAETVMAAETDVFNHNLETVPRLYRQVRPGADYGRSLEVLAMAARIASERDSTAVVKSGLMVGLGEEREEVTAVLADLKDAGCSIVTIGQYLQPRRQCLPVARYWKPEEYDGLVEVGCGLGLSVFAGPLVRSSYLADQVYHGLQSEH